MRCRDRKIKILPLPQGRESNSNYRTILAKHRAATAARRNWSSDLKNASFLSVPDRANDPLRKRSLQTLRIASYVYWIANLNVIIYRKLNDRRLNGGSLYNRKIVFFVNGNKALDHDGTA
jgi:hypothetical protein